MSRFRDNNNRGVAQRFVKWHFGAQVAVKTDKVQNNREYAFTIYFKHIFIVKKNN